LLRARESGYNVIVVLGHTLGIEAGGRGLGLRIHCLHVLFHTVFFCMSTYILSNAGMSILLFLNRQSELYVCVMSVTSSMSFDISLTGGPNGKREITGSFLEYKV
jgi:hypothetical protein